MPCMTQPGTLRTADSLVALSHARALIQEPSMCSEPEQVWGASANSNNNNNNNENNNNINIKIKINAFQLMTR